MKSTDRISIPTRHKKPLLRYSIPVLALIPVTLTTGCGKIAGEAAKQGAQTAVEKGAEKAVETHVKKGIEDTTNEVIKKHQEDVIRKSLQENLKKELDNPDSELNQKLKSTATQETP